jgi:hypothetical protein
LGVIEQTAAGIARLQAQLRLDLVRLLLEDTAPPDRVFVRDELALALSESPGTAYRWLCEAQMFSEYPAVIARVGLPFAEGGWSIRHADALLDAIVGLGLTPLVQQRVVDLVVAHPDARTPHQLRKAAQAAVLVLDPEAAERRLARARRERTVSAEVSGDGRGWFWAAGTASQVAMVMASIDANAGPKQPGDDRSLDQRRFDAFMGLICGRAVPGQWQAIVVATLETLDGSSEQPAELPGFGLISAAEARDLLAHAELRRAVVNERGELVSVDSTVHRPDLLEPVLLDPPHLPEPEPPSLADREWAEATLDREAQDALEPPPRYEREPSTRPSPPPPAPRSSSRTRQALQAARNRIRTTPLDTRPLSSTAYALPPRLARFVKFRDIGCSFPGCARLARDAQNDHLIPWPQGRSDAANMDSKCGHHHQAKTHGHFRTARLADGTIRWTTPLGRVYDRHPRPLLRGF